MSSFEWEGFQLLAEQLGADETKFLREARHRTAVSRAYYAAFNAARVFVEARRLAPPFSTGAQAHGEVIDLFRSSNEESWQIVGRMLRELRRERNSADYDDLFDASADVSTNVELGRRVLRSLAAL